ncbi:hypothetical protein ACLIYP_18865 [Streptomyces nanhaiensis]|uniref:hypothetical protein n=1 Tax=Streptomyces nanhaiensis TaxID=679319 RepID=UPI00399D0557
MNAYLEHALDLTLQGLITQLPAQLITAAVTAAAAAWYRTRRRRKKELGEKAADS